MATFDDLREPLGEPCFLWSDARPWSNLEQDLGATVWHNLGEAIREEPEKWADLPEEDLGHRRHRA